MTGRGGPIKRLPNLALAGKKESEANNSGKTNDGSRGRGNRARGRGRGRGRNDGNKPRLIQSTGIFSEGLSGGDPKKGTRPKDEELPTFSTNSRSTKKEEKGKTELTDAGSEAKTSFVGWDEMWESDDEGDTKELRSLLKDGFISDYKRGTVVPIVMPGSDEKQFINLMSIHVKDELLTDREEEERKLKQDKEEANQPARTLEEQDKRLLEEKFPTLKYSRKAASLFRQPPSQGLFMMQLPSLVGTLTHQASDDAPDIKPIVSDQMICTSASSSQTETEKNPEKLKIPRGKKIGKLQVTSSGRVFLKVGDQVMDVSMKNPGDQQEGVILLETAVRSDPALHTGLLSMRPMEVEGRDAIYHLGKLENHLVASLDWTNLKPKADLNTNAPEKMASPEKKPPITSKTDSGLIAELKTLDKERAKWAALARKWSQP